MRSAPLLAALLLASCTVVQTTVAPTATSALVTPSPKHLDTLSDDDLRVFALGAIPPDTRYVYAGESGKERLLLVDPDAKRVTLAAQFEGLGSFTARRGGDVSATQDRRTLVLTLSSVDITRVYVIRPEDATVLSFTMTVSRAPRVSPDGAQLVVARESQDPAASGLWLVDIATHREERLLEGPTDPQAPVPAPVQWSADGRFISLASLPGGGIGVYDMKERALRPLGPGLSPRWRGSELFYGGEGALRAYDTVTERTRTVFTAPDGTSVGRFELRPGTDDVASIETAPGRQELWLRGKEARDLRKASNIISMWWSDDGQHLYVWDSVEATTTVSDGFTGERIVDFCLRGSVSPPCS